MKIYPYNELEGKIAALYEGRAAQTFSVGYRCLDPYFKIKLGSTTYITGIPAHGKTTFLEQIKMNLSKEYSFKHLMFSPEIGSPSEIFAELAHTYIGKPFHSKYSDRMTEDEMFSAMTFIDHHYRIVDDMDGGSISVDSILEIAKSEIKENRINTVTIDPWNELYHDFKDFGSREDVYLEFTLGKIRRFARSNNVHIFIVAHPRTLRLNEIGKYDIPNFYEMKGGAAWGNKGEMIVCVYRPDMSSNQVEIWVQKGKPKIAGKKNIEAIVLDFDWMKNQYSEQYGTTSLFPGEKIDEPIINF